MVFLYSLSGNKVPPLRFLPTDPAYRSINALEGSFHSIDRLITCGKICEFKGATRLLVNQWLFNWGPQDKESQLAGGKPLAYLQA